MTNAPDAEGKFGCVMHNFTEADHNTLSYLNCTLDGMSGAPRINFHDAKNLTLAEYTIFLEMSSMRAIMNEREEQRQKSKSTK